MAALQGVPEHPYEAAELDGASFWGKFTSLERRTFVKSLSASLAALALFVGNF